ncbi:hypothetical protein CEXT_517061 [Caerostris extrusa]|uniref:Uncharacterized protein n=1 Tax=Caerostris extrusa TaxID=172846 RepID=A0AAV4XCE9_CAEEX|nr:hypothetical protein CEXT_517061 [Caerostris extrusa]
MLSKFSRFVIRGSLGPSETNFVRWSEFLGVVNCFRTCKRSFCVQNAVNFSLETKRPFIRGKKDTRYLSFFNKTTNPRPLVPLSCSRENRTLLQILKTWTTTRALEHDSLQEEFYNAFHSTRGSRAF